MKPQKHVQWPNKLETQAINNGRFAGTDVGLRGNLRKPSLNPSTSQNVLRDGMMPFENLLEPSWSQNNLFGLNKQSSAER